MISLSLSGGAGIRGGEREGGGEEQTEVPLSTKHQQTSDHYYHTHKNITRIVYIACTWKNVYSV